MTLDPRAALAGRRSVQLIRAWRRRDLKAMNAVFAEVGDPDEATEILLHLVGFSSDLLDLLPREGVEQVLADTVIDYGLQER